MLRHIIFKCISKTHTPPKSHDAFIRPIRLVKEFNEFDLYSKEDTDLEITPEIKKYYDNLLNEYFYEELNW